MSRRSLPIYQVDAFADRILSGNPAAVCPLDSWLDDETMQAIAAENNLAETAFFVPGGEEGADYALRWFTPSAEVDLCGHATLASAYVVFNRLRPDANVVTFSSLGGILTVTREESLLALDFPALPGKLCSFPASLVAGLGATPLETFLASHYLAVFESESDIAALAPNLRELALLHPHGVIVTAPGTASTADFVSRFFAPSLGIPEDPVTGSAHCTLTPYWSERLGRNDMVARQISPRGGNLQCSLKGDRVRIAGRAILYLEGTITI